VRVARFVGSDNEPAYGIVHGDGADAVLGVLAGHPIGEVTLTGERVTLADVRLLAPVIPTKIVGVGRNYAEHAAELGNDAPAEPLLFLKPSTTVVGPRDRVVRPPESERVDHEGELAVVIGALCRDVPRERALEVVFGYTCANDVTARDLQSRDGQWTRAKGFDTFCPLGPWIETELDPADLALTTTVNGELRQAGRTSAMVHDVPALVAYVSRVMTLVPGDVILTGTPSGVGPVVAGDEMTVSVEGVGALTNGVVDGG
jgi:2-keto-4-pentenoate hydratase/2-oxohepta-3-ene-1,7-dioic acid hydratase in catechol pathway